LLRDVGGRDPILPETVDQLYDAFQHPRADRPALPLLDPSESRRYVGEVRMKVIDLLDKIPLHGRRLTEGGFVFGMIAQHEQQHAETMLATHQLRVGDPVLSAPPTPAPMEVDRFEVLVPGGPFTMGTSAHPWALDNERPAHQVEVPSFWMDTVPVTNVDYQDFIADGGYQQRRWWHPAGWQHVREAGLTAPLFWQLDGRQWLRRRFGRLEPVPDREANRAGDAVQREETLGLELGHLDLRAAPAAEEAPLVLEVRADPHRAVRDLMRRDRAGLPFRHVFRVDQVFPDLVHGPRDLDRELEADHPGAGR
jgi:iron(II)-dependent oxidoreductase